jgi:hypothetical protein
MLSVSKALLQLFIRDVYLNKENKVVFANNSYMLYEEHDNANNSAAEAS